MKRERIMYIEKKSDSLSGEARIGKVTFSKSGQSVYYNGLHFSRPRTSGFKWNYFEETSKEEYWISGPRKDGMDRLYGESLPVYIDEDVREEYWVEIRGLPEYSKRSKSN